MRISDWSSDVCSADLLSGNVGMRVVRWLAWTALLIVGPVAIPPALGMDAELSDRIRWSGIVLQISGLFTVVVGLDESRQLFGKPTFIDRKSTRLNSSH